MSFEKLIEDMTLMAKALPSAGDKDDKFIQAAAGDEGEDDGDLDDGEGDDVLDGEGEDDGKGGGEMAKSFSFTLEDGSQVDAVDGTELIKSLVTRFDADKAVTLKALGMTVDMLKSQAAQIETLGARITRLSGEGRGRKTAVTVSEKSAPVGDMHKSQQQGMSHSEFFAKADAAQKAGRITAADIGTAETYLNKGQAVPASIISRVLG
jgi:hypothetical protein